MNVRLLIGLLLSIVAEPTGAPAPSAGSRAAWLVATLALVAVLGLVGEMLLSRHARLGMRPQELSRRQSRLGNVYSLIWITAYAVFLLPGRWSDVVAGWVSPHWWLPTRLLVLAPMLAIFLVACWGSFLMSAVVRRATAAQAPPHAAPPPFLLKAYLAFQFRQQLLILLLPYAFAFGVRDLGVWRFGPTVETPVLLVTFLAIYVLSPLMFRFVWPTEPLPPGPLRDMLEQAARRSGTSISGIYIWHTGGVMVNACLTGVAPPLRYIFLTDTLVRDFHPAQVEAVFGHELGHARFWHIPFYILMAVGSGLLLLLCSPILDRLPGPPELLSLVILVPYWGLLFGYLSRRFEWQCDLLGARLVSCPGQREPGVCTAHQPDAKVDEDEICPYQAWAFTSALARLASLSGLSLTARSWRHGSIQRRLERVSRHIHQGDAVRRFDHGLWTFKVYFLLALTALGLLLYLAYRAGWLHGP